MATLKRLAITLLVCLLISSWLALLARHEQWGHVLAAALMAGVAGTLFGLVVLADLISPPVVSIRRQASVEQITSQAFDSVLQDERDAGRLW